uniref:Secreted serine protease Snake n=1 Tax=Gryllus bimaculatus TaxID=6999 RepID=A0A455R5T8_GRYBI|nr:secreted serine protease Snake [Gryllus bimaculatus]
MALLLVACGAAQRSDGEACETRNHLQGECRAVSKCPWALELIKRREVPEICSFRGDTAIVCCVGEHSHAARPPPQLPRPVVGLGDADVDNSFLRPRPSQLQPLPQPQQPRPRPTSVPPWGGETAQPQPQPHRPRPGGLAGRIAHEKCRQFSADVTQTIEALPLVPNPKPVQVHVPNCDISRLPLIVGGENAELGEFPHMAAIGFAERGGVAWHCGGSLISDEFVLTAAHCTSTSHGPPVRVRLGELNLKSDADGASPVDIAVAEVIRHPEYRPPSKYHDIALLRLAQRARFGKNLRPACLYTRPDFPPAINKTIATGWGRIDYAESPSDTLLKVALDIIDNNLCNELWRSASGTRPLADGIAPTMLCAGVLKGGKDTCQGDSGGPIQITGPENKCVYHVVGVTSFGKGCALKNSPGVYTRVSSYVPWIESVVWPNE